MDLPPHESLNLPASDLERVVIVGGGFAGITLARKLTRLNKQVVLLDRHNYHQFQPLFYQVAMSGLEPSSIAFPFRKLFQGKNSVLIRVCEVEDIDPALSTVITNIGHVKYDTLVIATGVDTNYFGNEQIRKHALPMKSVSEALVLRNSILADLEYVLTAHDADRIEGLTNIVVVGGGPTGVELAGSLAEMRDHVLPKDYPEIDKSEMNIYLLEGAGQLLQGMSDNASQNALKFLKQLGVDVRLSAFVTDYDGRHLTLEDGTSIRTDKVIWAAGIKGRAFDSLSSDYYTRSGRLIVNRFNQVEGFDNIYALGDIASMESPDHPDGHPQVAQVAMQQGKHLARNWKRIAKGKDPKPFIYKDLGSMATVGRNKAVVDLPRTKFHGILAWYVWLIVHLFQILGVKNRIFIFLNWIWNYVAYNQSLRLIIGGDFRKRKVLDEELSRQAQD